MSGTLYVVVQPTATAVPSAAQIKAGQDGTGASLPAGQAQSKASTTSQAETFNITGLTAGTSYDAYFVWSDGATDSNVLTGNEFTTDSAAATGTGTLTAQASAVSGTGSAICTGTGTPAADAAAVSGTGVAGINTATGSLSADDATVVGTGDVVGEPTATGALTAADATVSGTGTLVNQGTGAPAADDATISGTGVGLVDALGTGALSAADSAISGAGVSFGEATGSGALVASDATVNGTNIIDAGGYFRRPQRRETEAYREWKRNLGKPDTSDLDEPEIDVKPVDPDDEPPPFEPPSLLALPRYEGQFFIDIPQRLPQVVIDLEAARNYREAMAAAKLAHLMAEDEQILLLLAGAI